MSLFSNHWKTYGKPEGDNPRPAAEVIQAYAKHCNIYTQQYLRTVPPDQYVKFCYQELVAGPQASQICRVLQHQ